MAFERIGILSIGEMGYHWAKILTGRGVKVLTYAKDRSETTRKRAENDWREVRSVDGEPGQGCRFDRFDCRPVSRRNGWRPKSQKRRPSPDARIFFIWTPTRFPP